jgi:alcohol-forming fatty acyl-CoA reductase
MFKRIMDEKPKILQKIVPVFGDVTISNFGLSDEQLSKVINETQIFFHGAASLKLEATLKFNVNMNLLGTKHAIEVARQVKNLSIFIHFSTAFCIPDESQVLQEKSYDWSHDPEELLRCNEWMDEEIMNSFTSKLLGPHPNTYTYTKRLAEILVERQYPSLPACIVRPSIVSPAFSEPVPGVRSTFK